MNQKLKKYELDFETTLPYVKEQLDSGTVLATILSECNPFSEGCFYTLLPEDADLNKLYEFSSGGILPQNPIIEYLIEGKKCSYSVIPTIQDQLAEFVKENLKQNNFCIFDDFKRTAQNELDRAYVDDFFYIYGEEVYYILKKSAEINLILKCIKESNQIWYSLCIITEANFENIIDKELNEQIIQKICLKARLIIIGAYDGEGYIFWKRSEF